MSGRGDQVGKPVAVICARDKLERMTAEHAAAREQWATNETMLRRGLVSEEGQAVALALYARLPEDGRPALGAWQGGSGVEPSPVQSASPGRPPDSSHLGRAQGLQACAAQKRNGRRRNSISGRGVDGVSVCASAGLVGWNAMSNRMSHWT